jgi:ATP-dependent DNA helicase RecG
VTFEKGDQEQLKKLGVQTLLDLALIIPHRYDNLTLSSSLTLGQNHVIEAEIKSSAYHPKYFKFSAFAKNLNLSLNGIIFHPRKYHSDTFKAGTKLYLR